MNLYGYVNANPIGLNDPLGLKASPGDNSIYPPTHNCSCVMTCIEKIQISEIPSTFCSGLYEKLGKGGVLGQLIGAALGELCSAIWK
jgi:hypothetical protein